MTPNPGTGRRLFQYALTAKGIFIAAFIALAIGVGAELAGPFIAKSMIDDHMLGIERPYYETASAEQAAEYKGHYYKRGDRFEPGETKGARCACCSPDAAFISSTSPWLPRKANEPLRTA
ncbi:putative multidrug resistance ABC transporter ATP-binding/permease protein YheH [Paenibacillus sp. P1XP2]|nr:putative multidrug resistance ABC transporter ATP-binding/permease protein YheH [Paenibacillus sp. P1XP2]